MKWVGIVSFILLLILVACTAEEPVDVIEAPDFVEVPRENLPTDAQLSACSQDSDCVPLPSQCHPSRCINKEYQQFYKSPEACTAVFVTDAAYNAEDCGCQNNKCVNLNAGRTLEQEDGENVERFYCEPTQTDPSICTDDVIIVCGFDADGNEVKTFNNPCNACVDEEVVSWVSGEC